jgi:2,5-diamino-6-(ribosylamino)-4(3H)-pyrimidinone 5'-phosphate reductase
MFRASCGAVMVGANTVIIDDPSLRLKYVEGRNPIRIVVDGRLTTPLKARVYDVSIARTILLTTEYAPKDKVDRLREKGVEVIVYRGGPDIDMARAARDLYARGIRRVLVEGGGELIWSLLRDRVVDKLYITISPYIFGGRNSVSLVMGEGYRDTSESPNIRLLNVSTCKCGNEVWLEYEVLKYNK